MTFHKSPSNNDINKTQYKCRLQNSLDNLSCPFLQGVLVPCNATYIDMETLEVCVFCFLVFSILARKQEKLYQVND